MEKGPGPGHGPTAARLGRCLEFQGERGGRAGMWAAHLEPSTAGV